MKLLKAFMVLSVILLVFSCSDDSDLVTLSETEQIEAQIEKRQWTLTDFTNQINSCEASQLTYFVDNCFAGTGYDGAIQASMDEYNDAPLSLNWTEVATAAAADLVFDCATGGWCGEAAASFPIDLEALHPTIIPPGSLNPNTQTTFNSGGSIGGLIFLNTNWTNCPCTNAELDQCFFMHTVMHEVAHALGLTHNDIENILTNNGLGLHINGTPTGADPTSVINSGGFENGQGNWCNAACEFNVNDITALQFLYPEVTLDGSSCPTLGATTTYCVTGLAGSNATLTWSGGSSAAGQFCRDFTFTNPGTYTVEVEICEDNCCYDLSMSVTPTDEKCYCVCEAQEQYGPSIKDSKKQKGWYDSNQIEEWIVEVDCCDDRPCSELIPEWWYEYLVDADECYQVVGEVPCDPPAVSLQGDNTVCEGQSIVVCINGSYNSSATWSVSSGGSLSYSSPKCRNFTSNSAGNYTVTVEVCSIADGEGQEDCCVTLTKNIEVDGNCADECFCRCWVEEQSGDDGPYQEDIPVDCNDTGDCEDIIPDWWDEYLTFPVDCEKIIQ